MGDGVASWIERNFGAYLRCGILAALATERDQKVVATAGAAGASEAVPGD